MARRRHTRVRRPPRPPGEGQWRAHRARGGGGGAVGPPGSARWRGDRFQLGGSWLLLAKLASRLAAAAGRELAVPDLFTASTLAAQARLVADSAQPVVPMRRVARGAPLPLSFEQQQLWFLDQMQPGNPEWVTPLLVRLPCDLTAETVRAALTALVTRHELLRTRYLGNLGEPRQVADEPGPVPLPLSTP